MQRKPKAGTIESFFLGSVCTKEPNPTPPPTCSPDVQQLKQKRNGRILCDQTRECGFVESLFFLAKNFLGRPRGGIGEMKKGDVLGVKKGDR